MRTLAPLLACLVCISHGRRVQRADVDSGDSSPIDQSQASSFVELVQSARSPVDRLKSDFLAVLRKEPNWKNVAKFITLADENGQALYGVQSNKWLTKVLRQVAKRFAVKDFRVDFAEENQIESLWVDGKEKKSLRSPGLTLVAQWSLKLDMKKSLFSSTPSRPIELEGETEFRIDSNSQVAYASVKSCYANGMLVESWPGISKAQNLQANMQIIEEWIQDVQAVSTQKDADLLKYAPYELVYNVGELPITKDIEKVMDTLKKDFANLFRKQPQLDIFAENLTISSNAGKELKGRETQENAFQLLRNLRDKFASKFTVHFLEYSGTYSAYAGNRLKSKSQMPFYLDETKDGSVLMADWVLKLDDKKGFAFWKKTTPVEIAGRTLFQINEIDDEIKVDRVQMEEFIVNGVPLEWPEVDLSDDLSNGLSAITEWVDSMKPQDEVADLDINAEDVA